MQEKVIYSNYIHIISNNLGHWPTSTQRDNANTMKSHHPTFPLKRRHRQVLAGKKLETINLAESELTVQSEMDSLD